MTQKNKTSTTNDGKALAAALIGLAVMLLCFAADMRSSVPLTALPPAESPAVTEPSGERVDINTAGLEELMTLPMIGEARARAILDEREEHGPFQHPEDLIRVKGLGEGIVSGLLDQVTTGGE